jgi:hypothetical protein
VAERPELEILEFEFKVFLPPPDDEQHRFIRLCFLFDRSKSIFILTKKIEDRLLLYVHQGNEGNLWQRNILLLKSAICRNENDEFSTLDVALQKQWRRFLILHIAPLRNDVNRIAYIRELRQQIVKEGDLTIDYITPEGSESESSESSSEDSRARRKRLKKEKRSKKIRDDTEKKKKKKKNVKKNIKEDKVKIEGGDEEKKNIGRKGGEDNINEE